jgi:hypothetical protein
MNNEAMMNGTAYTNCKISSVVLQPGAQDVSFNGFAWSSSMGMIHEATSTPNESWQQWLGTQQ